MKRVFDSKENCMMAIDGIYEFELGYCGDRIKYWKSLFFKKNSKIETFIRVRCNHSASNPDFWKYYIEVSRKGKIYEQTRICQEAYDVLVKDKKIETYPGVEFVILEHFKNPDFIK